MGPDWAEPKTLQHWPGKMINELANKVPTLLQYKENSREVKAWGFLCDQESEDTDILACFKLHLDPAYVDPRTDAPVPTLEEAREWFQDYLRCLHDHIEEYFSNAFPRWKTQRTEFVFSVPTTWKSASMIAETERLIKGAGYGGDGANHRVGIGLTEAEAAAVYASKQQFEVSWPDFSIDEIALANTFFPERRCDTGLRRWWRDHGMTSMTTWLFQWLLTRNRG